MTQESQETEKLIKRLFIFHVMAHLGRITLQHAQKQRDYGKITPITSSTNFNADGDQESVAETIAAEVGITEAMGNVYHKISNHFKRIA